jgi:hypothetical protein
MSKPNLKIGDSVWIFQPEHRVYQQDENGRSFGAPIWREHWREHFVIGETSRSWLIGWRKYSAPGMYVLKLPKSSSDRISCAGGRSATVAFSQAEIDEREWVHDHCHYIANQVKYLDYATLRKIAELIGYEEKPR